MKNSVIVRAFLASPFMKLPNIMPVSLKFSI
jgi:hypothetical protein